VGIIPYRNKTVGRNHLLTVCHTPNAFQASANLCLARGVRHDRFLVTAGTGDIVFFIVYRVLLFQYFSNHKVYGDERPDNRGNDSDGLQDFLALTTHDEPSIAFIFHASSL